MKINKIYCEDCLNTMAKMYDNFIDLTVTSPPYDKLRDYNGYCFDFENISKELYRVTKQGGVIVWVVGDSVIDGSETCTSFKQALYMKEKIGFKLHDTMIWRKPNPTPLVKCKRYWQAFEYMFIFSKGQPSVCNYITEPCKNAGKKSKTFKQISTGKTKNIEKNRITKDRKVKMNVWDYKLGYPKTGGHPATFPEQLVSDHIISWTNKGDLVYDPFIGSGTTAKMAILNNRKYIGSEISKEYYEIAKKNISNGEPV